MTPASNVPEAIDPRLAQARDGLLSDGEKVLAEENGDQGQAIFLTDARVLIIKTGVAATGQADGRSVGDFPLSEITAINVRKGPLGAVIQVVAGQRQAAGLGGPPDNVIVFTGDACVKRCDAMAAMIEPVLGKPLGRVQSEPVEAQATPAECEPEAAVAQETSDEQTPKEKKKGGHEPRSLADEMFSELKQSRAPSQTPEAESTPVQAPEPPPEIIAGEDEQVQDESEEELEPSELMPNPNLPKPMKHGNNDLSRVLVLLGLLMAAILVCVCITAPLRNQGKTPSVNINVGALTGNPNVIRTQHAALVAYQSKITKLLAPCQGSIAAFRSALRSGNNGAIRSALCESKIKACAQQLSHVEEPAGVVGAKESIISGLTAMESAVGGAAGSLQSSAPINVAAVLSGVQDGQNLMDKGLALIHRVVSDQKARLARIEAKAGRK
jgi:hypothetical protein